MDIARWCEECNSEEALVRVVEDLGGNQWTHNWCIECAKNKVLTDGEWTATMDLPPDFKPPIE